MGLNKPAVQPGEALQALPLQGGQGYWYLGLGAPVGAPNNQNYVQADLTLSSLLVPETTIIDQVAVNVETAGAAGSLVYAGIYRVDGHNLPDALERDFGSFDTSTTGVKTIALDPVLTLGPGLYWVGTFSNVSGADRPALTGWLNPYVPGAPGPTALNALQGKGSLKKQTPATPGSMPDPIGAVDYNSTNRITAVAFRVP